MEICAPRTDVSFSAFAITVSIACVFEPCVLPSLCPSPPRFRILCNYAAPPRVFLNVSFFALFLSLLRALRSANPITLAIARASNGTFDLPSLPKIPNLVQSALCRPASIRSRIFFGGLKDSLFPLLSRDAITSVFKFAFYLHSNALPNVFFSRFRQTLEVPNRAAIASLNRLLRFSRTLSETLYLKRYCYRVCTLCGRQGTYSCRPKRGCRAIRAVFRAPNCSSIFDPAPTASPETGFLREIPIFQNRWGFIYIWPM